MIGGIIAGEILKGAKDLFKYYEAEKKRIDKQKKQAMKNACELIVSTAKRSMAETARNEDPKSWSYSGRVAPHKPSLPDNPPAIDFNNLNRRTKYQIMESKDKVIGEAGTFNVDYAMALEYGRKDGHILPRPYLRPALEKNEQKIEKIFIKALQ